MERITVPVGGTAWGEEKKFYIWFTREGSEEPSFSSTAPNKEDVAKFSLFGRILLSNSPLPKTFSLCCIFASKESHSIEKSSTVGDAFHFTHVRNGQSFWLGVYLPLTEWVELQQWQRVTGFSLFLSDIHVHTVCTLPLLQVRRVIWLSSVDFWLEEKQEERSRRVGQWHMTAEIFSLVWKVYGYSTGYSGTPYMVWIYF